MARKNALRRWIYEYTRYNPQLGNYLRTGEVYACTKKAADRIAKIICDSYTAYGSICFKKIVKVSQPIVLDHDVESRDYRYEDSRGREKWIKRFYDKYPAQHSEGWDKLHDITEAD